MLEERPISRIIILHLIAVLTVIFNVSDIRIGSVSAVIPPFDLMIIFYFASFKKSFSLWFVFLLGIWSDALNGTPLGLTPLCYIMLIKMFELLNHKMLIKESFIQVWRQFVAFAFLFLFFKWLFLSLFASVFYSVIVPLLQLFISAVFYVVMHKVFDYLSLKLLEDN